MCRLTAIILVIVLPIGAAAADPVPNVKEAINRGLAFLAKDNLAWKATEAVRRVPPRPVHHLGLERGEETGLHGR